MKKFFLTVLLITFTATQAGASFIAAMPKGLVTIAHSAIAATTTSSVIDVTNYSLILVETDMTGSGDWTIHIQGSLTPNGTYVNWKEGTTALSTGAITADSGNTFKGVPNYIKIVATENSGTATVTIKVQPFN